MAGDADKTEFEKKVEGLMKSMGVPFKTSDVMKYLKMTHEQMFLALENGYPMKLQDLIEVFGTSEFVMEKVVINPGPFNVISKNDWEKFTAGSPTFVTLPDGEVVQWEKEVIPPGMEHYPFANLAEKLLDNARRWEEMPKDEPIFTHDNMEGVERTVLALKFAALPLDTIFRAMVEGWDRDRICREVH